MLIFTTAMADQILKCVGELQVISPSSYEFSKGTIRFIGPFNSDLGQIRASGYGGFGVMIADVSGLSSGGFNIRTSNNQGDSSVGGGGDPYPFTVQGSTTTIVNATVGPRNSNNPQSTPVLSVQRPLSSTSTLNQSELAQFFQNTIRQGESIHIKVGGGFSALQGFFGANYPDGDSSTSVNSRVYLGVRTSTSNPVNKALTIDKDGNVNIPLKLTATTIEAANYVGLPSQNLDPLTLDPTNNLVGINTATPQHTLDVNGDSIFRNTVLIPETSGVEIAGLLKVSHATGKVDIDTPKITINSTTGDVGVVGTITGTTISAGTYLNLPTPDVLPITLDKPNSRVGINNTNPSTDLDVTGNVHVSNQLTVGGSILGQLAQGAQPGIIGVGELEGLNVKDYLSVTADATVSGRFYAAVVNAGTYLNLPAPNVLPITLDKTNNRVGINKTTPTVELDVVGSIRATSGVDADNITAVNTFFSGTMSAVAVDTGSVTSTGFITGNTGDFIGNVDVGGDLSVNGGVVTSQLDVLGTITTGTINAATYLNLPSANVLPITLDTTNNRVGINKTAPNQALDVTGNVLLSGGLSSGGGVFPNYFTGAALRAGTGAPEGVVSAAIGSLYMRQDGTAATAVYAKLSGTGNTGWSPLTTTAVTALSFKLAADVVIPINTTGTIMSFVLPTAGTWQITISCRKSIWSTNTSMYLNETGASASVVYPSNISFQINHNGEISSPGFKVVTYTTSVANKTVYLNKTNTSMQNSVTIYSNATYIYALKLV